MPQMAFAENLFNEAYKEIQRRLFSCFSRSFWILDKKSAKNGLKTGFFDTFPLFFSVLTVFGLHFRPKSYQIIPSAVNATYL